MHGPVNVKFVWRRLPDFGLYKSKVHEGHYNVQIHEDFM